MKIKTKLKFETLTARYSLFSMYFYTGIMYFINTSMAVKIFTLLIGITIGAIIIDIFLYLLEFYEDYKINKGLYNEDK